LIEFEEKFFFFVKILNSINSPGPKMKFFVKNGLWHGKFHFWTWAINRIYKNQTNNDFNSIAVPGSTHRIIRWVALDTLARVAGTSGTKHGVILELDVLHFLFTIKIYQFSIFLGANISQVSTIRKWYEAKTTPHL
jgi:hypothetical protein